MNLRFHQVVVVATRRDRDGVLYEQTLPGKAVLQYQAEDGAWKPIPLVQEERKESWL